ncbi:MAG: FKBP-type peptidyl-prolyl cis-trans isomerase [Bacteroidales bacterium]|nr:FKBP-type peptidyl-prolyl cis-trans isomerase [Bacteroidales bacterium]
MKKVRLVKFILLSLSIGALLSSCNLDGGTEELELQHEQAMTAFKAKYGLTEAENIGDNIYLKILTPVGAADTVFSNGSDYVVVDLLGFDSDYNAFDVTDEHIADSLDVYRADFIYGPLRVNVLNTFLGFYKAIKLLPEGSEAVMLFPHDQAFGGYEPVLYQIKLHRVIRDIHAYLDQEFEAYRKELGMELSDTLPDYGGFYYKSVAMEDTSSHDIYYGDKVYLKLTARYVETDTAFIESFPGREYFPINNSGDSISFQFGTAYFPITEAVHIAINNMKIGETWEVLTPANYVYGEDGYKHPTMGSIIVPPKMPVHYTIELLGYEPFAQ